MMKPEPRGGEPKRLEGGSSLSHDTDGASQREETGAPQCETEKTSSP
jgi:hypothetical protein